MQTKFRRHQRVRLLVDADPDYIEYAPQYSEEKPQIKKCTLGEINVLLPNGQYHVKVIEEKTGETLAYAPFDEDSLEEV